MCGICGVWLRDEAVSPQTLIAMRDSIAHRGPDGASGVLLASRGNEPIPFRDEAPPTDTDGVHDIGLGHRRLSIIDLAGGNQPMTSRDRLVWLVYNGEIYNYRELRRELAARGHDFRTESDTEVVLLSYEEFGTDCPNHLNGIFAFAIWDGRRRHLMLARDHYGVKPLYYAQTERGAAFGSEVKAILASGLVSGEVDLDALGVGLTFRYTPSPYTLFRGIRKLEPGSSVLIDRSAVRPPQFFADAVAPQLNGRPASWAARLATEMDRAVHRQMVSDVPIGLSLSSGVDSSTLLALMNRWSSEPIRTFTIGFGDARRDDEVPAARRVAGRHPTHFQARLVDDKHYVQFMSRYMWHMEEPVGNESAPAYFFVAEMARDAGVKVLLTGQGPDELFAGYDRHVGVRFERLLRFSTNPLAQAAFERAARGRGLREKYSRLLASVASSDLAGRLLGVYTVFSSEELLSLLRPDVHDAIDWSLPLAHVENWVQRAPPGTPLEQMLWIDARTLLSDNLLLAEDKMAMAASVEARVPFLDLEFARVAESVPGSLKLKVGQRKYIHRRACAQWIGPHASRRRKIGFANPMAKWFRGSYQRVLLARLSEPGSFLSEYTNPPAIRRMLDEHREGHRDHTRKLHYLASLDAWHASFCE